MLHFLFATDFDDDAPGMFKFICQLAGDLQGSITMFHAFGTGELLMEKEINEKGAEALKALHAFVDEHLDEQYAEEISFHYRVDDQFASEAIPEVAKEESIDVVVMGMKHGNHSFESIFGNTTLDLLHSIECSVLVVPEGFRTAQINRLGCTTDFKFKDIALLQMLRELGKHLHKSTRIHCLHVFEKEEEESRVKKDMEVLYSVFSGRKGTGIEFEITSGELIKTIESFALRHELDLLVMNSHQRNFMEKIWLKSTSREVAKEIKIPLLVLKEL